MAFRRAHVNIDIWSLPVIGPGKTGEPTQVLASTRIDLVKPNAFSPDGRKIAFESDRSGVMSVWVANADGSDARLLFGDEKYGSSGSPAWSPDGRWIAFDTRKDGNAEIYVISAEGGAARHLTNNPNDDVIPCRSRDGKWIYFGSNRTGRPEIFKMPAAGGDAIQLTRNGGWAAVESRDGRVLFFTRMRPAAGGSSYGLTITGSNPLLRIPANGGEETRMLDSVGERSWAVADRGIWFLWPAGPYRSELRFFSSDTRKVSTVASFAKPTTAALDLSPDGRTLLYGQFESQRSEIILAEGFK
jgi:Tol biopolymer transport system component